MSEREKRKPTRAWGAKNALPTRFVLFIIFLSCLLRERPFIPTHIGIRKYGKIEKTQQASTISQARYNTFSIKLNEVGEKRRVLCTERARE